MKKRPNRASRKNISIIEPYLYLLPFFLGVVIFTIYPFIRVIGFAFKEKYNFMKNTYASIGFGNFNTLFHDAYFISALKNTGEYVLCVVPLSLCIGIFFATLLNRSIKLKPLFQSCFFLPMTTSVTALGLVWKWIYNYDYGVLNYVLGPFGIEKINWLNNPSYGMLSLVLYGVWSMLPITIVLLIAGLQNINPQYCVAAKVDGAKSGRIFFEITLPLLAPQIGMIMIINMLTASKVFNELFPLFGGKPGVAGSLYTIIYYIYDMFYNKWKLGVASAAALILFVIVFILTLIQMIVQNRWKHY